MTEFSILYTQEAEERLSAIARSDPKSARIIFDHLGKLPRTYASDPHLSGARYAGLRRNRVGKYRAIYRVLEKEREIHILTVALRKSAYD